jgi:hypothetical protein
VYANTGGSVQEHQQADTTDNGGGDAAVAHDVRGGRHHAGVYRIR